ncbi:Alpha/Beta hydrolase protein [Ilyonectria robusta]|uniref:Alpha/Beta hydrolase protein n=1 Tax=Ilyonectria robusta TaxID=1079257 RepID=UPI001E8D17D3|nr:Alpha/Beta hydrolase protein [Ilyonectria robusta]KAH8658586.1 Alpha/Beta hydrolase protein [Ilyonectria robusta]
MPYSLPEDAKPFTLHIPDDEYSQFEELLRLSRIGPLTWENQHQDGSYGVPHEWLEEKINSFSNFKLSVQDETGVVDLHFVGIFSSKEDAIPIVLLHGWPGSFLEFLPTLDLIQKKYQPAQLPFHVIVPSLPGYTLSSGPPQDKAWVAEDAARIIDQALKKLGFNQYVVQGGDVGCLVASLLGTMYDSVIGVHLNLLPSLDQVDSDDPDLSEIGRQAVQRGKKRFQTPTSGAAIMNSTRPATIGAVVSSNPLALLAWVGEKFLEWPEEDISIDEVLANVSLYWFTDCFPRCSYTYRGTFLVGPPPSLPFIDKPFGFSWFMHELAPAPQKILETKGKLVFYRQHEKGGHFAALERPAEFQRDIEDFMKVVLKGIGNP